MNAPVHHVVFDIGKVLIHYDPHRAFLDLIPDADERRWFLENICTHDWNVEQDRGRSWQDAEAILIDVHPERADHIRAFRRNWPRMVPYAYDDSVAVLQALIGQGRDVTMLTNFASDTFREAQERYPFLKEGRGVTVSGDIGMIKPERGIYEHHARAFGLEPKATLFIDDSEANVAGARNAGWQAVHFKDAETLVADLKRLGINVDL